MIAGLALHMDMRIAHGPEGVIGEQLVLALDLLQAKDVGLEIIEETFDETDAQANGVDVPGR
jgi:hypothetical protein